MKVRVGTRASGLALAQTRHFASILSERSGTGAELIEVSATGDVIVDRPLREAGGKGLFVKELDEALLAGDIDCAVHSLKDVPSVLPDGIAIGAYLEREAAHDVLLSPGGIGFDELGSCESFGTSSLRRSSQVQAVHPEVAVVLLRGNLETRIRKVAEESVSTTMLAAAGLARLGPDLRGLRRVELDPSVFVPAMGQGTVAVTIRADDPTLLEALSDLDHRATHLASVAERTLAAGLGGSCYLPVAGHASFADAGLTLTGLVCSPDGSRVLRETRTAFVDSPAHAVSLGRTVADELMSRGADAILASVESERLAE